MNCFVIMPFGDEFDDVYSTIQTCVEESAPENCRCFRLDESRPAGNITPRLVAELRAASFCVADLTGLKPNVMWELGYAMALGKPTIIVTQDSTSLPFDIHDMQCLQYERQRLNRTLDEPLRRTVVDTLSAARTGPDVTGQQEAIALVGDLRTEMARLKAMVADVVGAWQQGPVAIGGDNTTAHDLAGLEGAWLNEESQTHLYARMIGDDLLVPFCFRGNATLNGFYYSWRRAGDYWFSRYAWIDDDGVSGFAFLRHESVDVLRERGGTADRKCCQPAAPRHPGSHRRGGASLSTSIQDGQRVSSRTTRDTWRPPQKTKGRSGFRHPGPLPDSWDVSIR